MKFLVALTAINVFISGTTLAVVLFGAKKVQTEMDNTKDKANQALSNLRIALNKIEL